MTLKYALMATTAAVLLTTGGFAQAQSNAPSRDAAPAMPSASSPSDAGSRASGSAALNASTLHEIKDAKLKVSTMNGVTIKDLNDMAVYGADGKKIGEIDRVLGDSTNAPKAVAVDAGGFLGVGAHEVVFPLDKLQKGQKAKQLQTSLTKDQIQALDKWQSASNDKNRAPAQKTTSGAGGQPATSVPTR